MNKVVLMGRLTRDPEIRYTQGERSTAIARYTLAVDRRYKRDGEQDADFISCVAFGKMAEHAEKYYHKGIKITISGRIQTGSYDHRDGYKVYTTDVIVEEQEFAESKGASGGYQQQNNAGFAPEPQQQTQQTQEPQYHQQSMTDADGFMNIPDGIDEELPFH